MEVKILSHLRDHDPTAATNIIHLKESFYFRHHLCISFPLLSMNLYEFIKKNNFQGVSLGLIRRFAVQILTALRFLNKNRIVHCDLKPENILLKQPNKSGIKVIDFGSSCFQQERVYTYIQSRFYRSPEVILGIPYSMAIDMWSFGCILAELFTGCPLYPGQDEVEQLLCIMEIQDVPPPRMLELSTRKKHFFDSMGNPRIIPNAKGKKRRPGTKVSCFAWLCACGQDRDVQSVFRRCNTPFDVMTWRSFASWRGACVGIPPSGSRLTKPCSMVRACGHVVMWVRACTCECVRAIAHSITCGLCGQSGYWRAQFL